METRSNKILVAAVLAVVLAVLIAFSLWLTASRRSSGRPYDIVIDQSVSGLLVGSPVTFSGVPVGRVMSVDLDQAQPGRVRVRIDITKSEVPIVEGTVAHLNGDLLFGTALISLEMSDRGGAPLVARAGEAVPVIPLEAGGLGSLVNDPTPMVESIAYATDRLLEATTPERQKLLAARLDAMVRTSEDMAGQGPALDRQIAAARAAIRTNATASASWRKQAAAMRRDLRTRTGTATRDMRASMASGRAGLQTLNERLVGGRPAVQAFSKSLADSQQKIVEARAGVAKVTEASQQIERDGVAGFVSGPPTPDYKPAKK